MYVSMLSFQGQQDDARMCLSLALTSVRLGASVANYTEVLELIKKVDETGNSKVAGVKVRDRMTGNIRFVSPRNWMIGASMGCAYRNVRLLTIPMFTRLFLGPHK